MQGVQVPVRKLAGIKELHPDTRTCNALLRSLRYQGGFALMSGGGGPSQRVMLSPDKIGDITKASSSWSSSSTK